MYTGPNLTKDSTLLYFDTGNSKSYIGEPTTNYIYHQNPRIDKSYEPYVWTTSGTWQAKHTNAIRVYNNNGSEITGYVNGGVSDPTNAYHAVWIYDSILRKPVVEMKDMDGSWKAKYIDTGMNAWSTYGYTVGIKYTISWLQWTTNITRGANVGLHTRNSAGSWNFWDGLITGINTKVNTWERVYATFTISSSWDQTLSGNTIYMYGQGSPVATIRVSDVQLEFKSHPTTFNNSFTRSSTQGLLSLTSKTQLDLTNMSYDSNSKLTFDGTTNNIRISNSIYNRTTGDEISVCVVMKPGRNGGQYQDIVVNRTDSLYNWMLYQHTTDGSIQLHGATLNKSSYIPTIGQYIHVVATVTSSGLYTLYVNGIVRQSMSGYTYATMSPSLLCIGCFGTSTYEPYLGKIDIVKIHTRALTQSEVKKDYDAIKTRFNI